MQLNVNAKYTYLSCVIFSCDFIIEIEKFIAQAVRKFAMNNELIKSQEWHGV